MCFFFHHSPTLCATIKLCLTALETQQITNSPLLSPTLWLPGKSVNPSRWNGPRKGHSPTSCTDMCQYPIHTRLLQVPASWILQTSGDRDYTAFLGSLLCCLYGDSGQGTFQKWTEMRNEWLTFKSGYCSEQFVGFFPSWGDKDSRTLLNTKVSEPHVLVRSNWEQWSPKRIISDCTCKHYTGSQVEQQSVCILDMQTPYK